MDRRRPIPDVLSSVYYYDCFLRARISWPREQLENARARASDYLVYNIHFVLYISKTKLNIYTLKNAFH